jgi:competence protein ComEC
MKNRKIIYWSLGFLFLLSFVLGVMVLVSGDKKEVRVNFFDVGQGDSILISRGGDHMLVDGGASGRVLLEKLGRSIPFWDRSIEVLVLTHPDKDHLGGLLGVLQNYEVKTIVVTKYESETKVQKAWKSLIEKEGSEVIEAVQGARIVMGNDLTAEVLFPFYSIDVSDKKKSNNSSVAMKVFVGSEKFLLMGDLSKREERELMESGVDLNADILKVGHHGSRTSSGEIFLDAVSPDESVISVGKRNRYGHPHQNVVDSLNDDGVQILRTDEEGDVAYECRVDKEKCKRIL